MGFPLYHNPDGSIGKVYKLDNSGATVTVNDASFVPIMDNLQDRLEKERHAFHRLLTSLNVKSYRVNDGWVDRKNCRVVFFNDDREEGSYWYDSQLSIGDKIFIGSRYSGGRFAEIISSNNSLYHHEYRYKPLPETLDSFVGTKLYLTKYTVKDKLPLWKQLFGDYYLQSDIYGEEG